MIKHDAIVKALRDDWKTLLRSDPANWLLEDDNPSVQYFALIDLLGKGKRDPLVLSAKKRIQASEPVQKILSKQNSDGIWGKPEDFYLHSKHKGTFHSLCVLADLGIDGSEARTKSACEFILKNTQADAGPFSIWLHPAWNEGDRAFMCVSGRIVWALMRLGYKKDPRVKKAISWMVRTQTYGDGETRKDRKNRCLGNHACMRGVVNTLRVLLEIEEGERNKQVRTAIDNCAEFILKHHINRRSRNLDTVIKPEWQHFLFPHLDVDELFSLYLLSKAGTWDQRMIGSLELILSKQDKHGRWKLERSFNSKFHAQIEMVGRPSKWITLFSVLTLRNLSANFHGR